METSIIEELDTYIVSIPADLIAYTNKVSRSKCS